MDAAPSASGRETQATVDHDSDVSGARVLVVDDDRTIVDLLAMNLRDEGLTVITAGDGEEALERIYDSSPDLVILDLMMPKLDGLQVCQRLRQDPRMKHVSVIMLTARVLQSDKLAGLAGGADDYVTKPFDLDELLARVKNLLRRSRDLRGLNPLTKLPGNTQIQEELSRRIANGETFALMYIDLDNFKAFNDHYGFMRGDRAIKLLAHRATEILDRHGGSHAFLGHEGGDDFVAVVDAEDAEEAAQEILRAWDGAVPHLYDEADYERGYIEIADRRGEVQRYPLMTVSVGIATNRHRTIASHWEAAEIATEVKHYAKMESGSSFAIDRRRPGFPREP